MSVTAVNNQLVYPSYCFLLCQLIPSAYTHIGCIAGSLRAGFLRCHQGKITKNKIIVYAVNL